MTKAQVKKCDNLWREICLIKAGNKCEYPGCGKTTALNCHHIYSRNKRSTRWDIKNCLVLCVYHHTFGNNAAHRDPDFKEIIIREGVRTKEFFDELRLKAFTPVKPNYEEILTYLNTQYES